MGGGRSKWRYFPGVDEGMDMFQKKNTYCIHLYSRTYAIYIPEQKHS